MDHFIHIRSSQFPAQPGEDAELVNEGMYGKALASYLQTKLSDRGYDAPFICCEDWGWWVELKTAPFAFGVCVYSRPNDDGPLDFACTAGTTGPRIWSWRKFRYVDTSPWANQLHDDLLAIFQADPDIEIVEVSAEFPW